MTAPSRVLFRRLAGLAVVLALAVIVAGAFTRLSDAGLGCPDWPGCYGQLIAPQSEARLERAEARFPGAAVDVSKAWIEMGHRYAAGLLGLLILALAVIAWRVRDASLPRASSTALLALVVFQALLGMWTVTLLLKPLVVTAHLLGGMATVALLFWLWLSQLQAPAAAAPRGARGLALFAVVVLVLQVFLGGWVSTNYAALACVEFPTCHSGRFFPPMDVGEGFVLWRGLGQNYEHGVLDHPARTAIHVVHRLGAVVVTITLLALAALLLRRGAGGQRALGALLAVLLVTQLGVGMAIVQLHLPLPLATAHNGMAALLLLCMVAILHMLWRAPRGATA